MRPTFSLRFLQPTRRMMRPVPNEEQAAHTVSQRLRRLKKIPPELIPLGIVVSFAVGAACFSIGRKFVVDKNLRLSRQNRPKEESPHGHGEEKSDH
ncbi:uncharacterized protein MKZ38_009809 [Zalerion maritima]|uniref:Uncharacterized protein n=1 Tax=Zalerion maritima TaxID=339359 RepID=A0AAD5S0D3_9PEZI|nr:uncharacterized protein MKZ38_009809 [Zalerion maritima]